MIGRRDLWILLGRMALATAFGLEERSAADRVDDLRYAVKCFLYAYQAGESTVEIELTTWGLEPEARA